MTFMPRTVIKTVLIDVKKAL